MRHTDKFFLIFFVLISFLTSANEATISGYITDDNSGESIFGATIYSKTLKKGTTSNQYGFFSLTLPSDTHDVSISFTGYESYNDTIILNNENITLNVSLTEISFLLNDVIVSADKISSEVDDPQMSSINLSIKNIKTLPTIGGETDIIKVAQLLPGISRGGEGTTSLFVRGGDADQNLILLDEAVVYNIAHLFGFFSVFNPDALKDITILKGSFPAEYGGRLSSVLDIKMKEGNIKKFHGEGGIGLISSRLTLEGPIINDKMSFLISGRRTYINVISDIPYYFYDFNAKLNYKISPKDRIFASAYLGKDVLVFDDSDTSGLSLEEGQNLGFGFSLGNLTSTIRWNHIYNAKLFSNISFISTRFRYDIEGEFLGNSVLVQSKINDLGLKADFDYYLNNQHHIKFGGAIINHQFRPNIINTTGEITEVIRSQKGDRIDNQELALYVQDEIEINPKFKLAVGLRASGALADSVFYTGLEPRVATRYKLNPKSSIKLSYSRMKQYMHRVSNSSVALPTDLWYPVTKNVKPQKSDQIAFGYTRLLSSVNLSITAETYYKWMYNLIEYEEGANLILNNNFEDQLVTGTGDAYGFEFLLKSDEGRISGWIGYTLSWSTRDFDDLNKGNRYFAKYDRRHDFSFVTNTHITKWLDFSLVWVYSTGSRFTAQTGSYFAPNPSTTNLEIVPIYTERNSVQLSPSHRLDANFVINPNRNNSKTKRFKSEWHIGGYNVYNRAQPYQVRITPNGLGSYKYDQPGLFGFIFSVGWNFQF